MGRKQELDIGRMSSTVPGTLRQVAQGIDPDAGGGIGAGDAGYLNDAADALEAGTIDQETLDDAIAIAKEYQSGGPQVFH